MKIALIDSDIVAYRAAVLTENETEDIAISLSEQIHDTWLDASRSDLYVPCLTVGSSFRKRAWADYKANRKDKPRPRHLDAVINHIKTKENVCYHSSWEADDVMGFIQSYPYDMDTIIVSIDKDLDQIPGWHCNPDKETVYDVSNDDSDMYMWMQVLSGDTTDNYPGIPGIGQGKAQKILADVSFGDRESVVKAVYVEKGKDNDYYKAMLRCATIIKHTEDIECELLSQGLTAESTLCGFLVSLIQSKS